MDTEVRNKSALHKVVDDPVRLKNLLQEFRETARALSSEHPRLIEEYPNQWVAVYRGKVAAHAETFNAVLAKMKRKKIPPGRAIVRFIEKNQRTLILQDLCSAADLGTRPTVPMSKP